MLMGLIAITSNTPTEIAAQATSVKESVFSLVLGMVEVVGSTDGAIIVISSVALGLPPSKLMVSCIELSLFVSR